MDILTLMLALMFSGLHVPCRAAAADADSPDALIDEFREVMGFSESRYPEDTEVDLLWRVAAWGPEMEPVRRTLIERCYQDPLLRGRFLEGNNRGLRALIGLCPQRLALSRQQAANFARMQLADMRGAGGDSRQTVEIGAALARLGDDLPPELAAEAGDLLLAAMSGVIANTRKATEMASMFGDLRDTIERLGGEIPVPVAVQATERLVKAMDAAHVAGDWKGLCDLGWALAALGRAQPGANAGPEVRASATATLVAAMEQTDEMVDLHRLASTIAAIVGGGIAGDEAAMRAADLLMAAMVGAGGEPERPEEFWQVDSIAGEALAKLGGVLTAEQAGELAAAVAERSSGTGAHRTARDLVPLAWTLGDLNKLSTSAPLGRAAELIINAMVETDDVHDLANLCSALTRLGDAVPQAVVVRATDRLLVVMAEPREPEELGQLWVLGRELQMLGDKLPPEAAARAAGLLSEAIVSDTLKPGEVSLLGRALAGTMTRLAADAESTAASALTERILEQMERFAPTALPDPAGLPFPRKEFLAALDRELTSSQIGALAALGRAMAALGDRLPDAVAERGAKQMVHVLSGWPADGWSRSADDLAWALLSLRIHMPEIYEGADLALAIALRNGRLPGDSPRIHDVEEIQHHRHVLQQFCARFSADELVEVLRWPVVRGEAELLILAELEARTGASFGGRRSAFIRQAESLGFDDIQRPVLRPAVAKSNP